MRLSKDHGVRHIGILQTTLAEDSSEYIFDRMLSKRKVCMALSEEQRTMRSEQHEWAV